MRAAQYVGLGIRTVMGNIVYPQSNPGIVVSAAGISVGGGGAAAAVSTTNEVWNVAPAPVFTVGSASNYSVASTGPGAYAPGGNYDVDSFGSPLPATMSLNDAGSLSYNGSGSESTTTGVIFGYTEPGAISTLTLHPTQSGGPYPYMATVYPTEGAVPNGSVLLSPTDSTLRSTVLSRWPDNSAQVVVLAGQYTFANTTPVQIQLRRGLDSGTALTTAHIGTIVSQVEVNFGVPLTLATWTAPDRIWWANSQVICARYRLPITNKGSMEAVIDIHAFAGGRAFVEVVIENGKTNASAATVTAPTTQTYTNATVSVNGTQIQPGVGVSSPSANMSPPRARISGGRYQVGHTAFRSWYCSGWVGGDPLVEVTHDADSLQAHPWFFKRAAAPTYNLQTKYAQTYDTYEPWALCRLRHPNCNDGGDDEQIGLLTMEQSDYILTGDKFARRAVLATGIAPLSLDLAWRHTDGTVPTRAQVAGKNTSLGTWPQTPFVSANNEFIWGGDQRYVDGSHVTNIALVPFLCRPSPRFIEMAQCEFLFHHSNYNSTDGSHGYDQARARGWRARNMATTIFLTPDSDSTRKDGYRTALVNQINTSRNFMDQPWNTYRHIWSHEVNGSMEDNNSTRARFQAANYMHWLVALCWHSIANGKVLRGANQTMMESAANQVMEFPLRWFNDASSYEWRAVPYQTTVGIRSGNEVNPQFSSVTAEHFYDVTGTAPSGPGTWINFGTGAFNWQNGDTGDDNTRVVNQLVPGSGNYYPEHLWFVLCCAVERGTPGAEAAWAKVVTNGGINNLSTWLAGHGSARSYLNRFPRGK